MVSTEERDCFAENILLRIGQAARPGQKKITGFLAMKGDRYDHQLMVVGRAVNGWRQSIFPQQLKEPSVARSYADKVFKSVTGNDNCPMAWVTKCWASKDEYNTNRSAFWRVIRAVVGELGIANRDESIWPSYLVWSNLYKVAPEDGGNPNNTLCDIQLSGCLSLLDMELSAYAPKRLLLLTGLGWAEPFLQRICPGFTRISGDQDKAYVKAVGKFKHACQTSVVVASHPQGKPEGAWVREVMEAFEE